MKLITLLVFALLLSGCASTKWVHATKSDADGDRDWYDCKVIATQYAHGLGFGGNPLIIRDQIGQCMELKHGWTKEVVSK